MKHKQSYIILTAIICCISLEVASYKGVSKTNKTQDPFDYINSMNHTALPVPRNVWLTMIENCLEFQINSSITPNKCDINIYIPKKRAFEKLRMPSASVLFSLKAGEHLSQHQLAHIRHLVANSITNLKPDKVIIYNNNGNAL